MTSTTSGKPTIVLIHGSFADASGWTGVIERLQDDEFPVIAPSNPLRSLSGDSAYIKSILDKTSGPLVVVGHSYGGAVITNAAAGNPNVKALVYVDGFLPDVGEDALHLAGEESRAESSIEPRPFPPFGPNDLDFYIRRDVFREVFAADVDESTADVMWASQRPAAAATFGEPTAAAAWRTAPSWAFIGRQDKIITPVALRSMAERAGSTIVEADSSHVSMISHPDQVADLIKEAAKAAA
jgi:pimeloyl-ACP methyl ester carboxylesterase